MVDRQRHSIFQPVDLLKQKEWKKNIDIFDFKLNKNDIEKIKEIDREKVHSLNMMTLKLQKSLILRLYNLTSSFNIFNVC